MRELLRLADPVRLSFVEALLSDAGIAVLVLDRNMFAAWGAAFPPRLMVTDEDYGPAVRLLAAAGEIEPR